MAKVREGAPKKRLRDVPAAVGTSVVSQYVTRTTVVPVEGDELEEDEEESVEVVARADTVASGSTSIFIKPRRVRTHLASI